MAWFESPLTFLLCSSNLSLQSIMPHLICYHLILLCLTASPSHKTCRHFWLHLTRIATILLLKLCEMLSNIFQLFELRFKIFLLLLKMWNHFTIDTFFIIFCKASSWINLQGLPIFGYLLLFLLISIFCLKLLEPICVLRLICIWLCKFKTFHFFR